MKLSPSECYRCGVFLPEGELTCPLCGCWTELATPLPGRWFGLLGPVVFLATIAAICFVLYFTTHTNS